MNYTVTVSLSDESGEMILYSQVVKQLDMLSLIRLINGLDEVIELPISGLEFKG